ncbi:PadR family transcriptional regulator [Micromonospora sp. KC606]|uniref:PadR family transcriptional regulator n=1 Tax=Micromonospora sp. KC606 TaxID=2530379 RepID=UPI001043F497|nr:PadR family transcriptional regulator [Micromonospora sp. KC606]TDC86166.1 PadR family transcriptional regulator [Micromonospora sp. KC606]
MRITVPTARVLAALLADPQADRYGLDLMQSTGLASGTLYPLLHRLMEAGWLTTRWEEVDPAAQGRPARRYYRLTAAGATQARQALAEMQAATVVPEPTHTVRPAW